MEDSTNVEDTSLKLQHDDNRPGWCPDCGSWPCNSTPEAWRREHGVDLLDGESKRKLTEVAALKGARRIIDLPEAVAS